MTDPPAPSRPRRRSKAPAGPQVAPFDLRGSGALNWLRWRRRWVSVGLGDGVLQVTTRPDRVLSVPVGSIRRILAGREPYRSAIGHRLEICPEQGRSIIFTVFEGHAEMPHYSALLHGLATELERHGALDRLRLGLPRRFVFGVPLLIFLCLYGAIWFAAWSEGAAPAGVHEHLQMALLILALALIPTFSALHQGFHRRVRARADLDRLLG